MPYIVIAIVVILDRISKILTVEFLKGNKSITLIEKVIGLTYETNTGASFGIMKNQKWFLILLPIIMIGVCLYFLIAKKVKSKWAMVSLAFIIGGGIGNLYDRIFYGYVVDMFEFKFMDFAIFNVADTFITIGCVILALVILFDKNFFREEKCE